MEEAHFLAGAAVAFVDAHGFREGVVDGWEGEFEFVGHETAVAGAAMGCCGLFYHCCGNWEF